MYELVDKIEQIKTLLNNVTGIYRYFPSSNYQRSRHDRYDMIKVLFDFFLINYVEINNENHKIPDNASFLLMGRLEQKPFVTKDGETITNVVPSSFFIQVVSPYLDTHEQYQKLHEKLKILFTLIADVFKLTLQVDGLRFYFTIPGTAIPVIKMKFYT